MPPDNPVPQLPFIPPRLSIRNACLYVGGVSRTLFYEHIRRHVEVDVMGRRVMIVTKSLDLWLDREGGSHE